MISEYPNCYQHLLNNKETLLNRDKVKLINMKIGLPMAENKDFIIYQMKLYAFLL